MKTYGQYCPVARTSEILAERWTPIIVRNLLAGCRSFGELRAGAPGISKALLTQRLELLERQGVLTKTRAGSGAGRVLYELTQKGRELKEVTDAMGRWGARWLEVESHHLDPAYVLWATCKLVDGTALPEVGIVVRVELIGDAPTRFWLLLRPTSSELCGTYLGWPEDLVLRTDAATLAHWHLRHLSYEDAVRTGMLELIGSPAVTKAFLRALRPSPYATTQPASPTR